MGWFDLMQQAMGDGGGSSSGEDYTPPNLNWGDVGDILNQSAQYTQDNYPAPPPDNLNWPGNDQQPQQDQQQGQGLGWFGNAMQIFNQASQDATPGYQLNAPQLPPYAGPYRPEYMQGAAPDQQDNNNPLTAADLGSVEAQGENRPNPEDYFGNIASGIAAPWQGQNNPYAAPDKQGMNPFEWLGDNAGRLAGTIGAGVGSALGGIGAAAQPIGGATDQLANSGIPGLSQYAQGLRGYYENVAEPIFNFTPSIAGDIARGQGLNLLNNLNPFNSVDRDKTVSDKLKYVQDAYDTALANGYDDAQATEVAQNLDRRLNNFANLTEYAGVQKFGTFPALAQLGIMLADPVGNLGGEALLAGKLPKGLTEGRLAESTLGGRLGRTTVDGVENVPRSIGDIATTAQDALGYVAPMSLAGKAVGALGDITGLSGLINQAGEAVAGARQNLNQYDVSTEAPIKILDDYAKDNPQMTGPGVVNEFLNNPASEIYHETIQAPADFVEGMRQAYDAQPLPKEDPSLTPMQEVVKPPESDMAVAEQTAGNAPAPDGAAVAADNPLLQTVQDLSGPRELDFGTQKSNYIGDALSDKAEALLRENPKLTKYEAAQLAADSPDIAALRDTINTPEDLAQALSADAAHKPPPPTALTPEAAAASQDAFDNIGAGRQSRMPKPLDARYAGVKLPSARDAQVSEFYNTAREIKGVDFGALKQVGKEKPSLRPVKTLENVPVVGTPLRAFEEVTHSLFARPFLNTFSRLVRDPLGNLVKLGVQDPGALTGLTMSWLSGGKDTVSRLYDKYNRGSEPISTGHASASADVTFAHGAKSPLAQLWYVASNPHNELPALGIRLTGKLLGAVDKKGPVGRFGREKMGQFSPTVAIEKFEQGVKDYQGKREYVRKFQGELARAKRTGKLEPLAKQLGITSDEVLKHAIAGTLPKGADLADYRDQIYNPSNFSPEKLAELNKVLVGDAGPLGDLLKQTFDTLPDAVEAAKNEIRLQRDKEVQIAGNLKNRDNARVRANTTLTKAQTELDALDRISPDHPIVQKLWSEAGQKIDNHFTATAAVAVSDPALVAAYRKAAQDTLDYAAKTGDYTVLRQGILDQMRDREPQYVQQYQKSKPAEPTASVTPKVAEKPVATPKANGYSDVQQQVLDWSDKRYIKYDLRDVKDAAQRLDYEKHNKGRGIQQSQIKRWVNGEELGGKASPDRVLMYEQGHQPPVYWMSNKSKEYNPANEVPRGKQEAPSVPREAQGRTSVPGTTSGAATPPAPAYGPPNIGKAMQGYYDAFMNTATAKPTHGFSPNEIRDKLNKSGNPAQTLRDYQDYLLKSDEEIRRITGNRFKLDLDTMTPIGNVGSTFEGKYLTELAGHGKPFDTVHPVFGKALPKEIKGMDMPQMLDAIKQHYGEDAIKNFDTMDPAKRDAMLNEIANTLLNVKPIEPLAGLKKASDDHEEAHRLLQVAHDDIRERYDSQTQKNRTDRAAYEKNQDEQVRNTAAILGLRNRIAIQAHAAGYAAVKNTFFDYRNKNTVDQMLGGILPYQYWARQNFAYAMRHFAAHPMHFAALLNFYQTLEKENSDPNIPDYAKGDIFLWQNPDGSKVLWDFSSILPFNPLGSNDSIMQVVSPGDSTGRTTRNTDPLALLMGTDSVSATSGKVVARDKGILPSFFRPNPILELAFKTGNVNKVLHDWGLAKGSQTTLGQDYPESTRAQKETSGFMPGNSFYQEIGAATGLSKQLRSMGVIKSDLSPESLLNEGLFGKNAGKPQTKLIQELTRMAQKGEISAEQGKLAIAAYKDGNWTPEALKALDAVQGENAGRRLLTDIGFTSIVTNTPRQQLANTLYKGMSAAAKGDQSQSIVGPDGKKMYIPSASSQFFTANPGASVLAASGKSGAEIRQSAADDKTFTQRSALYDQLKNKQIDSRTFNTEMAKLEARNPAFFQKYPDKTTPGQQLYNEQLDQFKKIEGNYPDLSQKAYALSQKGDKAGAAAIYNSKEYRDAQTARAAFLTAYPDFKKQYEDFLKSKGQSLKEADPAQQKYFDQLDAYNGIGGDAYDNLSKQLTDAYARNDKKAEAAIFNNPVYQRGKASRDQFLLDNPAFAKQYKDYLLSKGYSAKDVDPNAPLTGTSKSTSSSSSTAKKTTTSTKTTSRLPAKKTTTFTSSSKAKSSGSASSNTPFTPAQKAAYAHAINNLGLNATQAAAYARKVPATQTTTARSSTPATRLPTTTPIAPRVTGTGTGTGSSSSGYTKAQAQGYAKALAAGKSPAYAAAVARNIGLQQGTAPTTTAPKTALTKPIVNPNTIGYTNNSGANPSFPRLAAAAGGGTTTRLPAPRSSGGGGGGSRSRGGSVSRSTSRSTRLPADAIRFSPGRSHRQPVRFG